jgi:hypothetical protein
MKAGFYVCDITPAVSMEQPGGYGKAYIHGIHDALSVRAAVIDDGRERVALVGIDTCELQPAEVIMRARRAIEEQCGIPADHVVIGASHTHNGGPFPGLFADDFAAAPDLIRQLVQEYSPLANRLYVDWVLGQIASAVCEADRRREDALLSVGSGREDQAGVNRRFRMKNGRSYTHPGKGNPDILEPAGPIDPEVGVLAAWRPNGDLLGCIVNYACHGTTFGGSLVSADWIGYLDSTIRGAMRTTGPAVFLQGAAGDITQVDNQSRRENEFGERWSRYVGTRVAAEALKVLATAERGELAPVRAIARTLAFARRLPSPERLEQSRRIVEDGISSGRTETTEWTFAKELILLDYLAQRQPEALVEVQAIQVGPAVFLSNPSEYFCQWGLDIKRASPFPFTYVVELANGCSGYVPTEDAFLPSGGGYETVLTAYSSLTVNAGRKIAETSVELARSLSPGAILQGPQVKTVGQPWSYGVLGPDV